MSYKFRALACVVLLSSNAQTYGEAIEEFAGLQEIECTLMPLSRTELLKIEQKSHLHLESISSEASTKTHIPIPFKESTSSNWSGYASLTSLTHPKTGSVTNVSGVWTVPTLLSTPGTNYVAIWTGIDGYSSPTVEQLGTQHSWQYGSQQNLAWFEMYPSGAYQILGFPVNPGDLIGTSVVYTGNGYFKLSIANYTHNVFYTVPSSYTRNNSAQRSSAEWIVEAPSSYSGVLPLSDYGTVHFTNCTAIINSISGSINNHNWSYDPLTMETQTGIVKSSVSGLISGGTGFSTQWHHQ